MRENRPFPAYPERVFMDAYEELAEEQEEKLDELRRKATGHSNTYSAFGVAFLCIFIYEWWFSSEIMALLAVVLCAVALYLAATSDPEDWG